MFNFKVVASANSFVYFPENKETIKSISEKFNVSENCVVSTATMPEKGDVVFVNGNAKNVYVVRPLENLVKVAEKLNVNIETLKTNNNLKSNNLFIGQKIYY